MMNDMDTVVALVSGGIGLALGLLLALAWARRTRDNVETRLERIEHMLIAPDQAWYWTPEWQAGERAADADLAAGRVSFSGSDEEFMQALRETPAADEPVRSP